MSRENNSCDLALGERDKDVKCRWIRLLMGFIIKPEFVDLQVHMQYFFLSFLSGKLEK